MQAISWLLSKKTYFKPCSPTGLHNLMNGREHVVATSVVGSYFPPMPEVQRSGPLLPTKSGHQQVSVLNPNGMHAPQGYWNSFNVVDTVTPLTDVYLYRPHWSICIILESWISRYDLPTSSEKRVGITIFSFWDLGSHSTVPGLRDLFFFVFFFSRNKFNSSLNSL